MKIVSNPINYKNALAQHNGSTLAVFSPKNKRHSFFGPNREAEATPLKNKQVATAQAHSRLNSTTSGSQIKISDDLQMMVSFF